MSNGRVGASDGVRLILQAVLSVALATDSIGCVWHESFGSSTKMTDVPPTPTTAPATTQPLTNRVVFLLSGQGSDGGFHGSQFTDYVAYGRYKGRANFVIEPMRTQYLNVPSHERLNEIATDLASAIGDDEHDIDVWAFSMGANCMYQIDALVVEKVGSSRRMHVILVDPMVLEDHVGGSVIVGALASLGLPIAKVVRDGTPYIKSCPDYINLSSGTLINVDLSVNPVKLVTKFFNGDRHYPWSGETELQRKILAVIDEKFEAALAQRYDPAESNLDLKK